MVQILRLKKQSTQIQISSLGKTASAKGLITLQINSNTLNDNTIESINAYIVPKLMSKLPASTLIRNKWPHIKKIQLADPQFNIPGRIDMLLGADFYAKIIRNGIKRNKDGPTAQKTTFGWIIFGAITSNQYEAHVSNNITIDNHELMQLLSKFWDVEKIPEKHFRTVEEEKCEQIFINNVKISNSGHYTVKIPIIDNPPKVIDSRKLAFIRLQQVEKRFDREPEVKRKYVNFMREYESLNHMERVPQHELNNPHAIYIPHHAVRTEKFRTVFDASCKVKDGVSLNDIQLNGEKLQDDLIVIIMRFRTHRIALIADIAKMYRQVLVPAEQQDLQRILWRENKHEPIAEYRLLTQTYGMKSAAFCCIRALIQCARDNMIQHRKAAEVVLSSFYVDDLLAGRNSEQEAIEIYHELTTMLRRGGFELAKWSTNSAIVNREINGMESVDVDIDKEQTNAVLGLKWNSTIDSFQFKIKNPPKETEPTKRSILADIARLYDPIGYLSPAIIKMKILIQKLWQGKFDWDDEITQEIAFEWSQFCDNLKHIENVKIPRWLGINKDSVLQIHGFADASEKAYGVAFYLRANNDDIITTNLVFSKTRVAPIKRFTVPKLELSAAHLMSLLLEEVCAAHNVDIKNCFLWTDSMIVLHWINKCPTKLDTFTGNRVAIIQEKTEKAQWKHIATKQNPADIASRGIFPNEIVDNVLWWNGPSFLTEKIDHWPRNAIKLKNSDIEIINKTEKHPEAVVAIVEQKKVNVLCNSNGSILYQHSTFIKLMRITGFVLRFIRNCRAAKLTNEELHVNEMLDAENVWIRGCQQLDFKKEIECLTKNTEMDKHSPLKKLTPFLDKENILRLSGRVKRSNMPYDTIHPIVLTSSCKLSKLLIKNAHRQTLHGGIQQCQQFLRNKYWIIGLRNAIRHHIDHCKECIRQRKQAREQLMAHLPEERVTPGKLFQCTSVDYAGPILIKRSGVRCKTFDKGYIAVFVCMKTKAVHLELVSDLTTDAFLAAFSRFANRRGRIHEIWSDNATTFHGAANEIKQIWHSWKNAGKSDLLRSSVTTWKFLPPASPHMAGLHERAVRSAKHHLKRVIGAQKLTFEQFTTLLVHVEACLNSRPMQALTEEATDSVALTAGHFITGGPIISPITRDYSNVSSNRLNHFRLLQKCGQEFWRRWTNEYVLDIMKRNKWSKVTTNLKENDIVLIKSENTPPTIWPTGKIVKVYPDEDNNVRIVDVLFNGSVLTRPITKLIKLPTEEDDEPYQDESIDEGAMPE